MIPRLSVLLLVTLSTICVSMATVEAQYRYTDAKGVTKTVQYKLDIPTAYRDEAEWIGPTGIGKPGLSEEARQTKQREDAYRRIGEANEQLRSYGGSSYDTPARARRPSRISPKTTPKDVVRKDAPVMCIAGELRVMTGPGHWEVKGACGTRDPGSWSTR